MQNRTVFIEHPIIPSLTVGPLIEDQEPVLLWVHTGNATITAQGVSHRLTAGQAIWVPPGVEHCTKTDADAVVFPFFLRPAELTGVLREVHVISLPPGWEEWLVHNWDDNSYTRDTLPGAETLLNLVAEASPRRTPTAPHWLPFPRSREALGVARAIMRYPGSPRGIEEFASRELVNSKTLQRQFTKETGLSFSEWRTRARVAIAAEDLAQGQKISPTSRNVGYATLTGFAKAFRRQTGLSPSEYARRASALPTNTVSTTGTPPAPSPLPSPSEESRPAPAIPARTFWRVVRPRHELMWVYRGNVTLRIGPRQWQLSQGQGIWVPAGLPHGVEHAAGALMLTIGTAYGRTALSLDELTVYTFPPEAETFLLHTMISEFTLFRPESGHQELTRTLFREQFGTTPPTASGVSGALGEVAAFLQRNPADNRCLADWAQQLRTTPEQLGQELLTQTGDTFPVWRARLRMDTARDFLLMGEHPSQIARRLGYASPATFTRAFTKAHGIPPREYQRRETRRPEPLTL